MDIPRLPEECLWQLISLTSPRDACRSEAVSAAFRSAAVSDDVWKRFLPSDYAEILARAVDRVEFASMKHLYFRLCDPILIDGGNMGFFLDRETGAKCFILLASELEIVWPETEAPQYWRWIQHPESWFLEVAELMDVCWLEIHGRINSRMLSKWSNYSAYLIYKLSNDAMGFSYPLQEVSITVGAHVSKLSVCLMDQTPREDEMVGKPQIRQDGWMEILLGEFYNEEGDDGEVDMSLFEIKGRSWKSGLIVQGIEIRPSKVMLMKMSYNTASSSTAGNDRKVYCHCNKVCLVFVAEKGKPENRGSKFYTCPYTQTSKDCHFFSWADSVGNELVRIESADLKFVGDTLLALGNMLDRRLDTAERKMDLVIYLFKMLIGVIVVMFFVFMFSRMSM